MGKRKKTISMPHMYLLLFIIVVVCAVATWILPAGEFDRIVTESGSSVIVPDSFHAVESSPVGPFKAISAIFSGMSSGANIMLLVFLSYAGFGFVLSSGAINRMLERILRLMRGRVRLIMIPIFLVLFGAASSSIGLFEEVLPFIPIFVGVAISMGYDALVGMGIVAVGCGLGYSGAAINPFTVGIAQGIAEVPLYSGVGYRLFCHAVMIAVASIYMMRYAAKVQKDPAKSLVYGEDFSSFTFSDESKEQPLGTRDILILVVFVSGIAALVAGCLFFGWYYPQMAAVTIIVGILCGFILGMTPNEIAQKFETSFCEVAGTCLMIGIARSILVVLQNGNIVDTVVYYASLPLAEMPRWLAGSAMLAFQTLLNFLIPSGSGQAATSMPIMVPLADVLNIPRDVAVLAFQFGDGLSNVLWPSAFAPVICGLAKMEINKWWRWFVPLFLLLFLTQCGLIAIAVFTGFGV